MSLTKVPAHLLGFSNGFNEQKFTATEGQTLFTLTNGSYKVGQKRLEVYIHGIKQTPDIFTETSNTSFTLNQGVPANTLIEAVWYESVLPAVGGHNANHKKGGVDELKVDELGNYKELIDDRFGTLSEIIVSVRDKQFGAKGDGLTDDTTSFQAAIDYVFSKGGGTVRVPNMYSRYKVRGGVIKKRSGVSIIGNGYPEIFTNGGVNYDAIFTKDLATTLENVKISGIFFNQYPDINLTPNNSGAPCSCITLLGKTVNVDVSWNKFNAVGGWVVGISDDTTYNGSTKTRVSNNQINFKMVGTTLYDASAIYAETKHHEISHNIIESEVNGKYRLVGGIETHGIGIVKHNTIDGATTGIHIISHNYTAPTKYMREIAYNTIKNAICPINAFSIANHHLSHLRIHDNVGEFVESTVDSARFGSPAGIRLDTATNALESTDIKIYRNTLTYIGTNPILIPEFSISNQMGGISIRADSVLKNIKVYQNELYNFPGACFVVMKKTNGTIENVEVIDNKVEDCAYSTYSYIESAFAYVDKIKNLVIKNNEIRHKTKNGMRYLLVASGTTAQLELTFSNNPQLSSNGFICETCYFDTATYVKDTATTIDIEHLRIFKNTGARIIAYEDVTNLKTRTYYANDLSLYNGLTYVPNYIGNVIKTSGSNQPINTTLTRVNDYQAKYVSGTALNMYDIVRFASDTNTYIVSAIKQGAAQDTYTFTKSDTVWPPYLPTWTGNTTVTNVLPTYTALGTESKRGNATLSGNGTSTSFAFAHGLSKIPSFYHVEAISADAAGIKYVTADATNLTVYFNTAPITGTNNINLNWKAEV